MGQFMTEFAHVILTRFNVRWEASTKGLSKEWLTERIRLFEIYCYPSLHQQTNQSFKWLVLLDSRSPDWLKEKMSNYAIWQNFVPIYLEVPLLPEELGCPAELKSAIRAQVPQSYTHLITTRIDNDDAISKDFIQHVQDCFSRQDSQGIIFPIGYQFHDGCLYLEYSKGNHFSSLIESYRFDDIKTVFAKSHSLLYLVAPVRQIWGRPSWLEVIHGANLANHAKHGLIVSPADFQRRFASDLVPLRSLNTISFAPAPSALSHDRSPSVFCKEGY